MSVRITKSKCIGCGLCLKACAYDAIDMVKNNGNKTGMVAQISSKCVGCDRCLVACKVAAIEIVKSETMPSDKSHGLTESQAAETAKSEALLSGYEQASRDAEEIVSYLKNIEKPAQLSEETLPSLVKNLENKESKIAQSYIGTASLLGGTASIAIGISISTSASMAAFGGGAILAGGIGAMAAIPFVGCIAVPVAAIAVGILRSSKVKKYVKEHSENMQRQIIELGEEKKKLQIWMEELQNETVSLDKEISKKRKAKFAEFKSKSREFASKTKIKIDDLLNTNTNKRIQQYNEVILDHYRFQKEIEEKVEYLFIEYQELLDKKKELERQMTNLIKLLNAMNCPERVLEAALK